MKLFGYLACALAFGLPVNADESYLRGPDEQLTFQGNFLMHRGKKFSGVVELPLSAVEILRFSPYREGNLDGIEEERYSNGRLAARREYRDGKKVGVHEAWYPDGSRRSHTEYTDDRFDGESWEWYSSGALALYARFAQGRCLGKKRWRQDGAIYQNYVFPAGQPVGLPGARLCFQLRRGE